MFRRIMFEESESNKKRDLTLKIIEGTFLQYEEELKSADAVIIVCDGEKDDKDEQVKLWRERISKEKTKNVKIFVIENYRKENKNKKRRCFLRKPYIYILEGLKDSVDSLKQIFEEIYEEVSYVKIPRFYFPDRTDDKEIKEIEKEDGRVCEGGRICTVI